MCIIDYKFAMRYLRAAMSVIGQETRAFNNYGYIKYYQTNNYK